MQSPTVRRRRLARELKRMREAAGHSIEEARRELGWTSGRLNHMESGRSRPDSSALRDLMNIYRVTDPARHEAILALGRQSKQRGWWDTYTDVLPDTYIGFEAEASAISTFQPIVIPGLLQTPEYAALLARANLARTEEQIQRVVDARIRRQQLLTGEDPPEVHAVLDEGVLLRMRHSAPELARKQITHLIEAAEGLNSITLQVHPQSAGMHAATAGSMVILDYTDELDPSIVYLETMEAGLYLEEPAQVAAYRKVFDHVSMDALSKSETIELLKKLTERG